MGLIWGKKLKQITKELQDSKRMLNQERTKREEEAREHQELEIRAWETERRLRQCQERERRIRDMFKYEYWKRISPLYSMELTDLRKSVRPDTLFYSQERKSWGVAVCYCYQCREVLEAQYFSSELEALRYMAIKQILGISPEFDTCMECYQNHMKACA